MFVLCVVGMRVTVWHLFGLAAWCCCLFLSDCVCLLDMSGSLLLLIFFCFCVGCLNGGCGLRETHAGRCRL